MEGFAAAYCGEDHGPSRRGRGAKECSGLAEYGLAEYGLCGVGLFLALGGQKSRHGCERGCECLWRLWRLWRLW